MADNLDTQSAAPATPPAGTKIATRSVTYSSDSAAQIAPVGIGVFAGADDAKTFTDVSPTNPFPVTLPSCTTHHKVSAGSTNATSVTTAATVLRAVRLTSAAAYQVFVHIYNKASAPTVGTDVPVATYGVQAGLDRDILSHGIPLSLGLAYAITKGIADNDAVAVLASDLDLELEYT